MDGHNYDDISCTVNVRSVEVFFDAADPNLIAFVDRLLQFESDQEFQSGKSVVGYVSLRFCQPSQALIAPEAFPRTVAVECSGLADEAGSTEFVDFAVALAQDPTSRGCCTGDNRTIARNGRSSSASAIRRHRPLGRCMTGVPCSPD